MSVKQTDELHTFSLETSVQGTYHTVSELLKREDFGVI